MNRSSTPAVQLLQGVRLLTGHLEARGSAGRERHRYGLAHPRHSTKRCVQPSGLGVRKDVVAEVLGHSVADVTSVHERYSYLPEKRDRHRTIGGALVQVGSGGARLLQQMR